MKDYSTEIAKCSLWLMGISVVGVLLCVIFDAANSFMRLLIGVETVLLLLLLFGFPLYYLYHLVLRFIFKKERKGFRLLCCAAICYLVSIAFYVVLFWIIYNYSYNDAIRRHHP